MMIFLNRDTYFKLGRFDSSEMNLANKVRMAWFRVLLDEDVTPSFCIEKASARPTVVLRKMAAIKVASLSISSFIKKTKEPEAAPNKLLISSTATKFISGCLPNIHNVNILRSDIYTTVFFVNSPVTKQSTYWGKRGRQNFLNRNRYIR